MTFSRLGRKPPEAPPPEEKPTPAEQRVAALTQALRENPSQESLAAVIEGIEALDPLTIANMRRSASATRARNALAEHLNWADELDDPVDRARAKLHAFSTHVDGLDPEEIEAAEDLFRAVNPNFDRDRFALGRKAQPDNGGPPDATTPQSRCSWWRIRC